MKPIYWITRAELQALFCTPIAWILLALFAAQTGFVFTEMLADIVRAQELRYPVGFITTQLFVGRSGVFPSVLKYAYLYIPLLSMGLMSREYSSGSIKLLYSAPIKPVQIVVGKYLAMLTVGLLMVVILAFQVGFACWRVEAIDAKLIAVGLFGIFLLIAAYAAIGLFMSCLTAYQMVAAIGTLAILALLNFVDKVGQGTDFLRDLTYWLSVSGRAENFVRGILLSKDVFYFVFLIALFLSWSILKIEIERKQKPFLVAAASYAGLLFSIVLLGYVSSRPKLIAFYDATREKTNTLSQASLEIIENIPGDLKITTYTNLLDADYNTALPRSRNADLGRFDKYVYAKPTLHMDYVYYYMPTANPGLESRYPNMSAEERAKELAKVHALDFEQFLPPDSMQNHPDLQAESFRFLRVVEHIPTGKKAYLRLFDDAARHPSEAEISIALKRMAMEMPVVGFLSGFGERDSKRDGDKHYRRFAREKNFRFSLVNQGFDAVDVSLQQPVDSNVTILMIADLRRALTSPEADHLHQYVARGGNMLITAEPGQSVAHTNSFLQAWGLQLDTDTLIQSNDEYSADLVQAHPTDALVDLSHYFEFMKSARRVVSMPGATSIQIADTASQVVPILEVLADTAHAGGDTSSKVTGVIASREQAGRTQKIVVLSDADCFNNVEISMRRKGIRASNFSMVTGLFNWLSDGLAPLDTRKPESLDTQLAVEPIGLARWSIAFRYAIPIGMLLFGSGLLFLRSRR